MINLADLRDPDDPQRRSYREVNAARQHSIPVGALVELESGARLFVVRHARDCDQTPLYCLAVDRDEPVEGRPGFYSSKIFPGWPEEALTVIGSPEA